MTRVYFDKVMDDGEGPTEGKDLMDFITDNCDFANSIKDLEYATGKLFKITISIEEVTDCPLQ